jgi:hypothetical protein
MRPTRALGRCPSTNLAERLTGADLGSPNTTLAKGQHERYCGNWNAAAPA